MGKTEFLSKDLLPAARKLDYAAAYVNLWENREAPEAAVAASLARVLQPKGLRKVLRGLASPVEKVKASAGVSGVAEGTLEAEFSRGGRATQTLREVFEALDKQDRPVLLVIDEAQVLAWAAHSDFAHALRAGLDVRKETIKVVFAGSSETTLRAMFASPHEPFYNWAPLEPFPLLGSDFVAFVVAQTNRLTTHPLSLEDGEQAFQALNRTPEFFRWFIGRYLEYAFEGVDAAIENTQERVFSDEHFVRQWQSLSVSDREVLRFIAHGQTELHGAATLNRLSKAMGAEATRTTVGHALRRLREANVITRLSHGEYHFEDEAFCEYVRRRPRGRS